MKGKTLADISTGPDWLLSVVIALFAVLSVLNKTRLCRVCWGGMAFITVLLLIMEKYEDVLPASIAHIFAIAVFADCIVMCVLGNTICRKK